VTVHPGHRVRGAILFQRRLGLEGEPAADAPVPPLRDSEPEPVFRAPRIKLRRSSP
jgi:hypothetical protein